MNRLFILALSLFLVGSSALAQTPLPPRPGQTPSSIPGFYGGPPVPDNTIKQARDQVEGNYPPLNRGLGGGQIQEGWNESADTAGVIRYPTCRDCTYKVRLREFMVTALSLPVGESVASVDLGDDTAFAVEIRGPRWVAVKPLGFGMDSNLLVYGSSGAVYPFYLRAEGHNSKHLPDLIVKLTGTAESLVDPVSVPSIHSLVAPPVRSADKPLPDFSPDFSADWSGDLPTLSASQSGRSGRTSSTQKDYVEAVDFDPAALHGFNDYTLWGAEFLRPVRVFRDGRFTYLQFGHRWEGIELPSAHIVIDGIDELVNTRMRGKTYIIESVADLITLKSGFSYLCIRYEGDA